MAVLAWGNVETKRRHHPHGHTIYDVYEDGVFVGILTHPDVWHAYLKYSDVECDCGRTKAEALAGLFLARHRANGTCQHCGRPQDTHPGGVYCPFPAPKSP